MEYKGKLFGKVGKTYFELEETVQDVEELKKDNERQKVVINKLQKDLIQEWEKQNESDYAKCLESTLAFMCKVYQDNFERSRKQTIDIGSFSTVQGFENRRLIKEISKLKIGQSKNKGFLLESLIAKYKDYELD